MLESKRRATIFLLIAFLLAAAGAAFGSVVPGLGTVVGAVAGIGIGLLLETNAGRNFKKAVETGIKKAYDGVKDFGAKMFKGVFG